EQILSAIQSLDEGPNFVHILARPGNSNVSDIPLSPLDIKKNMKDTPKVFQEASHYVDTMLRNYDKEDKFFGKMRGLAFMYYLAASIRSGFVNLTQNFQTGIPFLARELKGMGKGPLGAERIMTKAMWDVAMGRLTEKERFMDNELLSKGITNDQYMRQISREVGGKFEGTLGKVSEIISAPFSKAEIFNRRSAALAAFRVYKDQGLNFEESLGKIRDFIDKTHYLMTKANLPHAMRGGDIPSKLLGTAYTFRRFNHNYILSMVESLRGTDGKFHLANIDVLARSLTWLTILGGISSIPFADDILDQLEKMTGIPYRSNMRKWMREVGGDALERMGTAGIPALLGQIPGMVGTDISGSLNIGLPNLSQPTQGASETVFGVWGGLAKKAANAYQSVGRGDYLRAVEYASPIFLENLLKAVRMSTVGATTPTGRILYDEKGQPIKMTGREAAAQMMSFRPEPDIFQCRTIFQ
ncbi:MAG: PLxRFG domain-containing protein, partial [Candidatus Methanoperedens sp.]|nr:PLxRFG domain-containing protein [Candidatus Methanoperedens sp.]